ncbi:MULTISPECIES: hypothetical protein [Streptomyces]|uniref:Uncharacterized protein n=1 Tax=Streptomyces fradiae ATCC 10745 = DSM 40063 TaxID=1319510 RepID=A0A1Y2NNW6_STRFR|nr:MULTISPECIES: hypothetical protein [Streptomyces]KAF0646295.1 hypothetical protein K701_29460 [Streptomyces fradiae ATCC 10745 = DSM 40063]OSY49080.1 hypothetical protein BG846_05319 [Streptomyces fradiae ATCC 10745 = DSM 40063]
MAAELDLHRRAIARAHALVEQWQGDPTRITRAQAAEQLAVVIQLHGWTQTDPPAERHLSPVRTAPAAAQPAATRTGQPRRAGDVLEDA